MQKVAFKLDLDNDEFQQAFRLLTETNVNVFLTGKAGTGKSTFLKYICKKIKKKYVILAPTGVAAVNVGGVTIHSFFQMPLRPVPPDDPDYSIKSFRNYKKLSRQKKKLLKELDLIIIDEVSMVRPDMIDFIDRVLRGVRGARGIPFGGVQLLLVGDIFQLEPVVTQDSRTILSKYYPNFFFFNALAYRQVRLLAIELKKMYRQTDTGFISLLDRVRTNEITDNDLKLLNSRVNATIATEKKDKDEFSIVLASRRDSAAAINNERMSLLPGEEKIFEGEIEDDFPEKLLPTDMSLALKQGAQVMMVRNDKDKRWVNGTLAKVEDMQPDYITVELEDGHHERVEREIWENISYSYDEKEKKVVEKVIGRFSQFPLKAAWALTIHKSQGLTFSNVSIDMGGGAFTAGQTYVALSRCRSLEGLHFMNPLRRYDVIVSKGASDFSKKFNDTQEAEWAIREAEVKRLSYKALKAFENENMTETVETTWKIHNLAGSLAKASVRRLISTVLSVTGKLKKTISSQQVLLSQSSKALCSAAEFIIEETDNAKEGAKLLEQAIKADSGNSNAKLRLAQLWYGEQKFQEANRWLDMILKPKDPCYIDACLLKGDLEADKGNITDAAVYYQNAAKKSGKDKRAIERLVRLYIDQGMDDVAEQWKMWLLD